MRDVAMGRERGTVAASLDTLEVCSFKTVWRCEQWSEEAVRFVRDRLELPGDVGVSSELLRLHVGEAEAVREIAGNLLVNGGITRLLNLLVAAGGTAFNNANAFTGVGDSTTAAAATDSDLGAGAGSTHRLFKAMNGGFPSVSAQTATFASDFVSADANFAWQEWGLTAGASSASGNGFLTPTTLLNHKITSLGTKVTGTWTLTTTATIS